MKVAVVEHDSLSPKLFEEPAVNALRKFHRGWRLTDEEEQYLDDFVKALGDPPPTNDPTRLKELLAEACNLISLESVDYKRLEQIEAEAGISG